MKSTALKLALALGIGLSGAAVALLGIELRARQAEDHWGIRLTWDEPERKYALKPKSAEVRQSGFKDRDRRGPAPPDTWRVVVLGDSVTFGGALTAERTYPGVAEQWLRDQGVQAELVNLAVHGYDVGQIAATMRYQGWQYEPDAVVYGAFTNDGQRTQVLKMAQGNHPVYVGLDPVVGFPGPALGALLQRRSAQYRRLRGARMLRELRSGQTRIPYFDETFFTQRFAELVDEVNSRKVPLLVWGMPPHLLANPDVAACDADAHVGYCEAQLDVLGKMARSAEKLGVPFVNAVPALRAEGSTHYFPEGERDPVHPSPEGHQALGRGLGAALLAWREGRLERDESLNTPRRGRRPPKRKQPIESNALR